MYCKLNNKFGRNLKIKLNLSHVAKIISLVATTLPTINRLIISCHHPTRCLKSDQRHSKPSASNNTRRELNCAVEEIETLARSTAVDCVVLTIDTVNVVIVEAVSAEATCRNCRDIRERDCAA